MKDTTTHTEERVQQHYDVGRLLGRIDEALRSAGIDPTRCEVDAFAPRGFHTWVWSQRVSLAKAQLALLKGNLDDAVHHAEHLLAAATRSGRAVTRY